MKFYTKVAFSFFLIMQIVITEAYSETVSDADKQGRNRKVINRGERAPALSPERTKQRQQRTARQQATAHRREIVTRNAPARGVNDSNSLLIMMFNDPEISDELGISEDDRQKIQESFADLDENISIELEKLRRAAAAQAELVSARAPEEDIMRAVEKVGLHRTEIAKLQTRKVIELRKHLSDEKIKEVDRVRRQRFRMNRVESRGEGVRRPTREQRTQRPDKDRSRK